MQNNAYVYNHGAINAAASPGEKDNSNPIPVVAAAAAVDDQSAVVGQPYHVIECLGKSTYGSVASAVDVRHQWPVAIKRLSPFHSQTFCQRSLREIRLLSRLRHENIVQVIDIVVAPTIELMCDVFIVSALMETNMERLLTTQRLSDAHACYFLHELLCGLKYIHSANVAHRDLNPSNLLVNAQCDLKICDFGLARVPDANEEHRSFLPDMLRAYRAPEITLNSKGYEKSMDMWSVGCIFSEMLSNEALFDSHDDLKHLQRIIDVIGSPSDDDLSSAIRCDKTREYVASLPKMQAQRWCELFPDAQAAGLDVLDKMLVFNPRRRINPDQALQHVYFAPYRDDNMEPTYGEPLAPEGHIDTLPIERLKLLIFQEAHLYRPSAS